MLDSILYDTTSQSIELTASGILYCTVAAIIFGLVIAAVYMYTTKKYSKNYIVSLVILPILVEVVITMVNGNLGTGVAIMGAFSLVRFRSLPGQAKDICGVFFAMAVGLATGMGYIGYAAVITIVICLLMIVLEKVNFGGSNEEWKHLHVTIPENLNYNGVFDSIFQKYVKKEELLRVKTTEFGSMYDLYYQIQLINPIQEKEMIDEIRCLNGNLPVTCGKATDTAVTL